MCSHPYFVENFRLLAEADCFRSGVIHVDNLHSNFRVFLIFISGTWAFKVPPKRKFTLDSLAYLSICSAGRRMIDHKTLTISERCARSLLGAWNTGDLAGLETALRHAAAAETDLSSCEKERMEMVQEIAGNIRMWLRGIRWNKKVELNAHLELLRHLAGGMGTITSAMGKAEDFTQEARPSSVSTEGPRLEMLVCGPRS
jgi:hypothetical protein